MKNGKYHWNSEVVSILNCVEWKWANDRMQNIELISTHTQLKWIIFDSNFNIFFFCSPFKQNWTNPGRHWAMRTLIHWYVRTQARTQAQYSRISFRRRVSLLPQISTNKLLAISGMNEWKSYSKKNIMANCLPLWLRIEFGAARHNLSFAQMLELDIIWLLFFPLNTNEGKKIVYQILWHNFFPLHFSWSHKFW